MTITFISMPHLIHPILYGDGCFYVFCPDFATIILEINNIFAAAAIYDDITDLIIDNVSGTKDVESL
jgi:hypothetical protein